MLALVNLSCDNTTDNFPIERVSEHVINGNKEFMNGNYSKAKVFYMVALDDNSEDALALNNLAEVYEVQNSYDSSLYCFNLAIKLDSLNPYTYNNRGELFEITGDKAAALKDFNNFL